MQKPIGIRIALVMGLTLSGIVLWFYVTSPGLAAPGDPMLEPPRNMHTALVTSSVSITYKEPISPATVSTRTFAVNAMQTGLLTETYAVHSGTIMLTPTQPFHPGELVQVSATTGTLTMTSGGGYYWIIDRQPRTPTAIAAQSPISPTVWQFWTSVAGGSGVFTDSGQGFLAYRHWGVDLGDLDGDGDLDAVTGEYQAGYPTQVWRNDGAGQFSDTGQDLGSGIIPVVLGDVDGDSDLDVFLGNYGTGVASRLWLNDGTGVFTDSGQSISTAKVTGADMGDVDGDGDLDLFLANDGQADEVWTNDGTGAFTLTQMLPAASSHNVALGDVDDDGDLDAYIVHISSSQPDQVWLNDGTGTFVDSGQTLGVSYSDAVALGDLDADGDLDAFIANRNSQSNEVWLNGGAGVFTTTGQSLGTGGSGDVQLGDVDGDSDLDAFIANGVWDNGNQPNKVWLNDGIGFFSDSGYNLGNARSHDVALGDVDGDGDLDAFIANYLNSRVWLNQRVTLEKTVSLGYTATQQGLLGCAYQPDTNPPTEATFVDSRVLACEIRQPGTGLGGSLETSRWTGYIYAPVDGIYTLEIWVDDGTRLWLDNVLRIDEWHTHTSPPSYQITATFESGQWYPIKLDYCNLNGAYGLVLYWQRPDKGREVVPLEYLAPTLDIHRPNAVVTYTLAYSNITSDTLTNVTISDTLAPQLQWLRGGIYNDTARTVTFNLGDLAPHAAGSVSYTTRLILQNPTSGLTETVTNTAAIALDGQVEARSHPVSAATYGLVLDMHKTVTPTLPVRGVDEILTYTIAITNSGNVTATGVVLEDAIPAHTTLLNYEADRGLMHSAWPMFHQNLQHTGRSPHYGPLTNTLHCTYTTAAAIKSSPVMAQDGTIYFGSDDYYIYALTPDCALKWRYPTSNTVRSTPAIAVDGTIYVGSHDGYLYALNSDGTLKWRYMTNGRVESSPSIGGDGMVYVGQSQYTGEWTGAFFALYPEDGRLKWKFTASSGVLVSPAIAKTGTIYFNAYQGTSPNVYAMNPSGELEWSASEIYGGSNFYASPAIAETGKIYMATVNGAKTIAFNPNGVIKWRGTLSGSIASSPAIGYDGTIYIGANDNRIYAINPDDGTSDWVVLGATRSSPAIDAAGTIYAGNGSGQMSALEPITGSLIWQYNTGVAIDSSPAIGSDGTLYFGCDDGVLYAIGPGQAGQLETSFMLSLGDIPPGDARSITVTVRISETLPVGTIITNTAIISATNLSSIITATRQATVTPYLYVAANAPPANALHITPSTLISATFNRAFDPASITTRTFTVWGKQTGIYTGSGQVDTASYVFDPAHDFKPGEEVVVNLSDGIRASNGLSLTPYSWQFRAAVAGGSGVFSDTLQQLGGLNSQDVALADFDGDDDLDAFVANTSFSTNKVWINLGTGVFTDSGQVLGGSYSRGVAVGDLDADGDLDAFVANGTNNGNAVWLNDGLGNFTHTGQTLGNSDGWDVTIGDIDGDSDLDAVVVNALTQTHEIWVNNGAGIFGASLQNLGNSDGMSVALGDVDNDGDLDVFIANLSDQPNEVWFNDGHGNFYNSGQALGNATSQAVALGDLDNDGDLDAFVGNVGDVGSGIAQPDTIWLNDGLGFFTHHQYVGSTKSRHLALGDIDADGDLDAFATTHWDGLADADLVWLNDGQGNFSDSGQKLGSTWSRAVALGDLDNDNDLDVFVVNGGNPNNVWLNQPATCHVRLNDSPNAYPTVQAAIDAAQDGDTVKVAGTCTGVQSRGGLSQTAYISKSITLRGGYTTTDWTTSHPVLYPTMLDAQQQGRVVYVMGDISATVEGLWLTGGGAANDGPGMYIMSSTVTISHSHIFSNVASNGGAGIHILAGSTVTLSYTIISSNTAIAASGGGIWNNGELFVTNSTIISNSTPTWGGGIRSSTAGIVTIRNSTIAHNTAGTNGGGITTVNDMTIINSTINHNHTSNAGGGIENGGQLTVTNSTISHNTNNGKGGGVWNSGVMTLSNTTINGNSAQEGGGIRNFGGMVSLRNTIIANNLTGGDCDAPLISMGHNLDSDNTCGLNATGDITNTDPLLGPLQDNGGDTFTHALQPGSPAIDAGTCVAAPVTDQRGVLRPQGRGCDIGAYEATLLISPTHITITGPVDGLVNISYPFTATVNPTATLPLTYAWQTDSARITHHASRISDTVSFTWTTPGPKTITVTASNVAGSTLSTYTIDISTPPPPPPPPLDDVSITGVTTGWTHTAYRFTTAIRPITAATPMTYTWYPNPTVGQGKSRATYSWAAPGTHTITVRAENMGRVIVNGAEVLTKGAAVQTHTVVITRPDTACPTPLADVTLLGPVQGVVGADYVFAAIITPAQATLPVTYTWVPAPGSGQGTSVAVYHWAAPGVYTVTATAVNCGRVVSETLDIAIGTPSDGRGDRYEDDDTCEWARDIPTDGTAQTHTFHDRGDTDWVEFQATAGVTYVIQARVPATSVADVDLELYDTCTQPGDDDDDQVFGPEVRLVLRAPTTGPYYVRLQNIVPRIYGDDVVYRLSVRELPGPVGALVLVAGKYKENDPLQRNIYTVTHRAYQFAQTNGCSPEHIYYLAPDTTLPGVDGLVTTETLKYALTHWAKDKVNADYPLTLFMMDHGDYDRFYLNGRDKYVAPAQLNQWLAELKAATGAEANVVIEACNAGSFIDPDAAVSQGGRVVIASTGANAIAKASQDSAIFSDAFFDGLEQGLTLAEAFWVGETAARAANAGQTPWLDDDGDKVPNTETDSALAMQRGFACRPVIPVPQSPPHITQVELRDWQEERGRGELWARVEDDREVKEVWAVVVPPSYRPPQPGDEIAPPAARLMLEDQRNGWYQRSYSGFGEIGVYRIMIYAEDDEGLRAPQRAIQVHVPGDYVHVMPDELPTTLEIPVGAYTTTVAIPKGAFTTTTSFTTTGFTDLSGLTNLTGLQGLQFAGRGFDLTAYQQGVLQEGFIFQHSVTITVRYSDADMEGLDEESLLLAYYDGADWATDGLTETAHLTATNQLIVRAAHLTRFALFGEPLAPAHSIYLPLIMRK